MKKGMKAKSIKKMIDNKLNEWVSSIGDENVNRLIRRDAIVTGGSIASMLTGEDVNDYDIYLKTMEATEAVAEYYAKEYNASETATNSVTVVTGRSGMIYKKIIGDIEEDRVMLFIQSNGVAKADSEDPYSPVFMSDNAITLTDDIQVIIRFHGSVKKIHSNFDFIHATCSYEWEDNKLNLPAPALESLLSKDLHYMGSKFPICSMFRLRKFISRGWNVTGGQMLKIGFQISELNLSDIAVLRDQLIGVDTFYFLQLITAINERKENDPNFKIDATYIGVIIDKIFD